MTDVQKDTKQLSLLTRTEKIVVYLVTTATFVALLSLALWHTVVVRVNSGEVGVRYSLLFGGTVLDKFVPEGIALKLPWDKIIIYDARIQKYNFNVAALSNESMSVIIDGTVLYRPYREEVARLHKLVGPRYRERAVIPITIAAVRKAAARYKSHELYSIDFESFEMAVRDELSAQPTSHVVDIVGVPITRVKLPPSITNAIESKLTQEQLLQAYRFRLQTAEQEALRKRIEAIGINTYNSIVNQSLTDDVLHWTGLRATLELARSENSKVVVVGNGEDGLPLILGSDIHRTETTGAAEKKSDPLDLQFPIDPSMPELDSLPDMFMELDTGDDSDPGPDLTIDSKSSGDDSSPGSNQ